MESSRRRTRGGVASLAGRLAARLAIVLAILCPSVITAQGLSDSIPLAPVHARVSGRVIRPLPQSELPAAGVMVTVHRVGPDVSGPLDSARTDAGGRYTIDFTKTGSEDAVYFAAVVYNGIAYFSAPLKGARVSGDDGIITVFDTTSVAPKLSIQGHHIVISTPKPSGERDVVEVWEVSNDSIVTFVGRDSVTPVWSAALPAGATHVVGGEGDVAASSIVQRNGRVELLSAFGPGIKQVSYSYALPPSSFPLVVPVEQQTGVLEILLEEQTASASGARIRPMDAATTQGRTFRRFLGQDVLVGESVRISVPAMSARSQSRVLAALSAVMGLAMLAALARAYRRRAAPVPVGTNRDDADALLAAIAALDARHDRGDPALDAAAYERERSALKARAAAALAAGGGAT